METQRRTQQPAGRMERPAQMVRPSPLRPSLRHVSTGAHRGWKADLGRGLPLAATRQPEVAGVRSSATENTHRGSRDHHTSEAPLLSDVPRVGPPLSLSPEWRPYLPRHLEGLHTLSAYGLILRKRKPKSTHSILFLSPRARVSGVIWLQTPQDSPGCTVVLGNRRLSLDGCISLEAISLETFRGHSV